MLMPFFSMRDIKLATDDAFNNTEHEVMVPEPEEGERMSVHY